MSFSNSASDFGAVVVHGHTPARFPQERSNRIGIDTYAVRTGKLTAVGISRPAPVVYFDIARGRPLMFCLGGVLGGSQPFQQGGRLRGPFLRLDIGREAIGAESFRQV